MKRAFEGCTLTADMHLRLREADDERSANVLSALMFAAARGAFERTLGVVQQFPPTRLSKRSNRQATPPRRSLHWRSVSIRAEPHRGTRLDEDAWRTNAANAPRSSVYCPLRQDPEREGRYQQHQTHRHGIRLETQLAHDHDARRTRAARISLTIANARTP